MVRLKVIRIQFEGFTIGNETQSQGDVSRVCQAGNMETDTVGSKAGKGDVQGVSHFSSVFSLYHSVSTMYH